MVGVEVNTGKIVHSSNLDQNVGAVGLGWRRMEPSAVGYGHDEGICPREISVRQQVRLEGSVSVTNQAVPRTGACETLHLRRPHWFLDH